MDQYIGKLLDNRYELLECIGTGGMAVVYKARCHRLNRLVAVKILKPELASDGEFRRRFRDESQAVAMLSHPNIVAVYDVSHYNDLDYIVMELIDGITLKQYMQKRHAPLNWREALHFITQIMKALGHAHSRGIIHRDIKPHNIMVLRDGSVKVADFGIARLTSAAQSTLTQEALGSVHYISPEQARGSHIDGRSDIYSAGVVLYEMTTGRLPFEGDTPVSVAIQHINSIPLSPREINPDIPEALEAITMRAMSPNPDRRYPNADAMLADLEEFRKNPGLHLEYDQEEPEEDSLEKTRVIPAGRRSQTGEMPSQEVRRRAPADTPEPRPRPKTPRRTEREEKKHLSPVLISVAVILLFIAGIFVFLWTTYFSDILDPGRNASPPVPNLLGKTYEEIMADAEITNTFTIQVGDEVASTEYSVGQVARQSPEEGETIQGSGEYVIEINLSSGPPEEDELRMVDVSNKDSREALHILQDEMGLVVNQEEAYDDTVEKGFVISFWPTEGTILQPGDSVTITISKGPNIQPVAVPSFLGKTLEEAQDMLDQLGLELGSVTDADSTEYDEGQICYQSVSPNVEVDPGTSISFQVSKGPGPNPPPDESPEPSETTPVNKTIEVDLSHYTDTISLRVVVGNSEVYNSAVDPSTGPISIPVSATGTQTVQVYVDNALVENYQMEFTP